MSRVTIAGAALSPFNLCFAPQAVQDIFLAAKNKKGKKKAYNRIDREIKQKDQKYRVAVPCSGNGNGKTAVRAAILTPAKPAMPAASAVSSNACAADWKTLDTLRSGPSKCQKQGNKKSPPEGAQ